LTVYGPEGTTARWDVREYVHSVVRDEWPALKKGKRSMATEEKLIRLFDDVGALSPTNARTSAIYAEMFTQLNGLVKLRRDRVAASRAEIPQVLWVVALIGSILTILYASAFAKSRYSSLMICGVSLTIGLLFLFLLSVDYPFRGRGHLGNDQLTELPKIFDDIDRMAATASAPLPKH
jgi:hypothetical protein